MRWRENLIENDLGAMPRTSSEKTGTNEEKNPYADAYDAALKRLTERESFSYSPEGDAMYQHYKNRYTGSAHKAMKDTMGQAAAMTGGYASSYAQIAGQQAYDSTMQGLDDVIPELYQIAVDRYNSETADLENRYLYASDAYDRWEAANAEEAEESRSLSETQNLNELFRSLSQEGDFEGMLMQLETLPLTDEELEYYYNMIPMEWLQAKNGEGDLDLVEGNAESWLRNADNVEKWKDIIMKLGTSHTPLDLTDEEWKIYEMLAPLTDGLPS